MWQALETKARFIAQVMSGDCAVRKAEDIGGQELSYAEVKAIASGNPAVLTLAETDAELKRLAVLKKQHASEQYTARKSLKELPGGDCVLFDSVSRKCTVYGARPRQCRTWPFWDSNLKTPEDWKHTCSVCPGSGQGQLHTLEAIEPQRRVMKV